MGYNDYTKDEYIGQDPNGFFDARPRDSHGNLVDYSGNSVTGGAAYGEERSPDKPGSFYDALGVTTGFRAHDPSINPNAFEWGGSQWGAPEDIKRYQDAAQGYRDRQGAQITNGQYRGDRFEENMARMDQNQAYGLMAQRAYGNQPSVAEQQMMAGLGASQRGAMSQAAGTRGTGANIAGANWQAQNQQGALGAQAADQARILRAQEMASARGQLNNMANQMRQNDYQRSAIAAEQAARQAQLQQQQNAINDKTAMGFEGLGYNVGAGQLGAQIGRQELQSANQIETQKINAGINEDDAAAKRAVFSGLTNAGSSGLGAAAQGNGGGR